MNRIERKLLVRNALLGLCIIFAMLVISHLGGIDSLERWFYDLRAQTCQFSQPTPTNQLVHLDIDDSTLDAMDAWPWPRQKLAQIVDELKLASAKVIAFDVLFTEPQLTRLVQDPNSNTTQKIEDDRLFAKAIKDSKCSLLSVGVTIDEFKVDQTRLKKQARQLIHENIAIERDAFVLQIKQSPLFTKHAHQVINLDTLFIHTRQAVLFAKASELLKVSPKANFLLARQAILPHLDVNFIGKSPLLNTLTKQFDRARSMYAVDRYASHHRALDLPASLANPELPPIAILSEAAMGAGFVNYIPDADGVVRSVPLTVFDGQKALPQLGLALACAYMDVHPRDIRYLKNHIQIPKPDGSVISLPIRHEYISSLNQKVQYLFDIPWFGPAGKWEYMYDPQQMHAAQHLPVNAVYQIFEFGQNLTQNNLQIDKAISMILDDDVPNKLKLNPDLGKAYRLTQKDADDVLARTQMIAKLKADAFVAAVYADFVQLKADELNKDDRYFQTTLLDAYRAMDQAMQKNQQWLKQIADARETLKQKIAGKAVIIGWTGTATLADFVQTPLHHKCPGVVVHGTIFNAIMTGESWTRAPEVLNVVMILFMGIIATAWVALLSPVWALIGCLGIASLYLGINGFILFDQMNLIVKVAGPSLVVGLVWAGCTLNRFVVERTERARITRRFSSYVDPALVNYVINNPDTARLDGELKHMTVVFTDLAGFTTLTEKLREATVPILNEYMGLMVPIIRKHSGYVNKFLGDGMMFFYAAPLDNPNHAHDAVQTALELQHAMIDFNRKLHAQDLPQVSVRIGISTGDMVVGDAGSEDASDYTVLGDSVNLAARLESANKYTGTRILINDTCRNQLADTFLFRPVGKLQVVGKSESIMTYEPLCRTADAEGRHQQAVSLSTSIMAQFEAGHFESCHQAIQAYENKLGQDKFSRFYQRQCEHHQQHQEDFNGCIVLNAK